MSITRSLLTLSLAASLAGCFGRSRRYDTFARDTRNCPPSQHWERDRCVNNDRGHDDRDRDRDRDDDRDRDRR